MQEHRADGTPSFNFERVITYSVAEAEEAAHFFEHTLGLELGAEDGTLRFYALGDGTTLAIDVSGLESGTPPYLLFSTPDVTAAAEHFLGLGCQVRELRWASGAGFIAASPEGH